MSVALRLDDFECEDRVRERERERKKVNMRTEYKWVSWINDWSGLQVTKVLFTCLLLTKFHNQLYWHYYSDNEKQFYKAAGK